MFSLSSKTAMLSIFVFLLSIPYTVLSLTLLNLLRLPTPLSGPAYLAFDSNGEGPYTGSSDGRIFKYEGPRIGFTEFAFTPANRSKSLCDFTTDQRLQSICGRPMGLTFNQRTGNLYIADADNGLFFVGPNGGPATRLACSADGVHFNFLAGLDIDQGTRNIYFTQASSNFKLRDLSSLVSSKDSSGSLFKYNPRTKKATTLLRGLSVAAGVAVSKDGSFVLVSEFLGKRINRFWLRGPKANTSETFLVVKGTPHSIRRNSRGEFWVAVNRILGPPPPPTPPMLALGLRVNEQGQVLQEESFALAYGVEAVSEVQEFNFDLYTGSLHVPYAASFRP
ncbi:protein STRICTOSIDINE SYNTHASE-LIKE 12 [Ziziphus jujuba]|uniref:Protein STRICTOSIDINE SYNTHASE-LIKE 12 n=1 Tax=Ziziphus jujuba TaxID=326968 RepID=A0ABM3IKH7_ZIZJJ|nr:protein STRICTOSIDINE SYNTHASE-LIKE 12 [Ziziphus jujuba]